MSIDIKAKTREWFERVWNQKDESGIAEMADPQVVCHGLDEAGGGGLDTFKQFYRSFVSAFPDIHIDVRDVILEGDKTVARLSFAGTHQGEGLGIPATGNRFQATAIAITRWKGGRIVEAWNEFDAAGMMKQLQSPGARLRVSR